MSSEEWREKEGRETETAETEYLTRRNTLEILHASLLDLYFAESGAERI